MKLPLRTGNEKWPFNALKHWLKSVRRHCDTSCTGLSVLQHTRQSSKAKHFRKNTFESPLVVWYIFRYVFRFSIYHWRPQFSAHVTFIQPCNHDFPPALLVWSRTRNQRKEFNVPSAGNVFASMHIVGNWHRDLCLCWGQLNSKANSVVGSRSPTMSQFFHSIATEQTDQCGWTKISTEHRMCYCGASRGFLCVSTGFHASLQPTAPVSNRADLKDKLQEDLFELCLVLSNKPKRQCATLIYQRRSTFDPGRCGSVAKSCGSPEGYWLNPMWNNNDNCVLERFFCW